MEHHFRPGTPFPYLAVGPSLIGRAERYGGEVVYAYKTREQREKHMEAERAAMGFTGK